MPSGENLHSNPNSENSPEVSRLANEQRGEAANRAELEAREREFLEELARLEQQRANEMAEAQALRKELGISDSSEIVGAIEETKSTEITPEEAAETLKKAKAKPNFKKFLGLTLAAVVLTGVLAYGMVKQNQSANAIPDAPPAYSDTIEHNQDVTAGKAERQIDMLSVAGGVDYDNDGQRDLDLTGEEKQWSAEMDQLDQGRYDEKETAWNLFDGSKMLSGGLGARPIGLELMDAQRNFEGGALEAWSGNTLEAVRHNIPSTIMGELIMHGTVVGDAVVVDGRAIDLSEYLNMLENGDNEVTGKWQNEIAQDQHEVFDNGTVIMGRTPDQYYSVQVAIDKTSGAPRMEVVIVDTTKFEDQDLQNEARQWVDLRKADGSLFFDDSEALNDYLVAYLGLPQGTKLEVHSDNSGGNQICAWVGDKETPPPQDTPVVVITPDPGTGSEGTGSEGTGSEGTGSEGTGTEGTGVEGTGYEGTGYEGTGYEGTGNEITELTPKDEAELIEHAGDRVDVQDLDMDVTPRTTLEEDQANFEEIKRQRQEDANRAAEAERVRAEQAEAERRAAEEAEARRQAEREAAEREAAEREAADREAAEAARQAEAERQAAADEAARRAAEEAAELQRQAAEAERQAAAEREAAARAQEEADRQAAANAAEAESNADATAAERADMFNKFNNGDS